MRVFLFFCREGPRQREVRAPGSGEMLIHVLLQPRGGAALVEALEPLGSPSLSLGSEPVGEADPAWEL